MKLDFGTAGIRGIVGSEEHHLNEIHVARVIDGYARYLLNAFSNIKERGIVIGRDNRIKGKEFTLIAAQILTSYGIKIYFNFNMLATPFISYLTRTKKAIGAINITASHNPKEYNGIKIYDQNGCQLLPDEANKMKSFFKDYNDYLLYNQLNYQKIEKELLNNNLVENIKEQDFNYYVESIKKINFNNQDLSKIKIVYSPLHGTGYPLVKKIFNNISSNVIYEKNEIIEDSNFTYVENPNPEYKIAFKNTIDLANKENADLILVTDPDSDRVGVAIRNNEKFELLNGNEIAILITDYLLENKKIDKSKKYYLIYSFVSTSLPAKMCQEKRIKSYICETGFKWIGNKINELNGQENFFFAFEESYGSLINEELSHDKDAIQSLFALAIIAAKAKENNNSLLEKLELIYQKYGHMEAKSFSFNLKNEKHLEDIKNKFKNLNFQNTDLLDYNKTINGIKSDMLVYQFKDNLSWISLRPSGTEPKVKIYIHLIEKDKLIAKNKFNNLLKEIEKIMI